MKNNGNIMMGIMVLIVIVIVAVTTLSLGCAENGNITGDVNDTGDGIGDDAEYVYRTAG